MSLFTLPIHIGFFEHSILSLYYEISTPQAIYRTSVAVVFVFITARPIGCTIAALLEFILIEKLWEAKNYPDKFLDFSKLFLVLVTLLASMCLIFYIMPIPHVLSL